MILCFRVSLGITTVLTMTFLGLEARTDLPKVSYPTALDFFVFLSFAFIFATILQFAVVHYFTKYGSGECYFNFLEDSSSESGSEDEDVSYFFSSTTSTRSRLGSLNRMESMDIIPLSRVEIEEEKKSSRVEKSFRKFMRKYFFCWMRKPNDENDESINESEEQYEQQSPASTITQNTPRCSGHSAIDPKQPRGGFRRHFNSVSKIDKISRVAFPLLFFVINLLYWIFYLSRSQRK